MSLTDLNRGWEPFVSNLVAQVKAEFPHPI